MPQLLALLLAALITLHEADASPTGVQHLSVPDAAHSPVPVRSLTLAVDLDGVPETLRLRPHSLRAPDFKLFASQPDGALIELPPPPAETWRGSLEGRPGSTVTATLHGGEVWAVVTDVKRGQAWQIQPVGDGEGGLHTVVRTNAVESEPTPICHAAGAEVRSPRPSGSPVTVSSKQVGQQRGANGVRICELAIETDYEYFVSQGSSVSACLADIENIVNQSDAVFVRDTGITFQLTAVVIRSSINDPYSGAGTAILQSEFRNEWLANFSGVRRDIAHMFTGISLNDFAGVSYVGTVCGENFGFSVARTFFSPEMIRRVALTAHELGHDFNATHCSGTNCGVMNPSIPAPGPMGLSFQPNAIAAIQSFAETRFCLSIEPQPLALPFWETFEQPTLDGNVWVSAQGAALSMDGVNEPSGVASLQLSAQDSGLALDDFLISKEILLGGAASAEIAFSHQHRGVPSGGALVMELKNDESVWVELARITSDGTDETSYDVARSTVPSDGLYDGAQIRFRTEVNGPSETWFIDDVRVYESICGGFEPYCAAGANSASATGAKIGAMGTTSALAGDLTLRAVDLPASSFAIWIFGDGETQSALGNGYLCVSGTPIFRLGIRQSDPAGVNLFALDQTQLPVGATIAPGDTIRFQAWYRDSVGAGFNLTNGLRVSFCP